jgi:Bacterial CdiA-CT RNAse A domain
MHELIFKFETEILRMKWGTALVDLETTVRRYHLAQQKANFNPAQPRVPAGNPDGGQWTSGGGVGRNDPQGFSDATPDDLWIPGAQYAQDATQRRYSVNLIEEEARGGHAIRAHVGKSDEELLATLRRRRFDFPDLSLIGKRYGSFESIEAANDFVNRTLELNKSMVDLVASGKLDGSFVTARFGYVTGREAFRPNPDSEPYLRNTYSVGVEIRRDTRAQRGYRVITAYPRND